VICRGVSTNVERRLIENAKIKVQGAKLRNPDLVGMGVLVVASFSISRILYLLDVYYTSTIVGCQANFCHRDLGAACGRNQKCLLKKQDVTPL
jgi:hypothetical protein